MKRLSIDEIITLVQKITDPKNFTEAEIDAMVAELKSGVIDPQITDYIFWYDLTPEQIADKALSYQPICL